MRYLEAVWETHWIADQTYLVEVLTGLPMVAPPWGYRGSKVGR
jgi:hypothetical protein